MTGEEYRSKVMEYAGHYQLEDDEEKLIAEHFSSGSSIYACSELLKKNRRDSRVE